MNPRKRAYSIAKSITYQGSFSVFNATILNHITTLRAKVFNSEYELNMDKIQERVLA